jgi:hypothetical protein
MDVIGGKSIAVDGTKNSKQKPPNLSLSQES